MGRKHIVLGILIAAGAIVAPVSAHHSSAMFDPDRTVTVSGTVKDFEWSNPHVWLDVLASDGKGGSTSWAFECGSVNQMFSQGWHPRSLKPGDQVTVIGLPVRAGGPTAALKTVKRPDGSVLGERPKL